MNKNSPHPQRKIVRLKGYDYTLPGAYFVTLLAWQRQCLFGEIDGDEVRLSSIGKVLDYYWNTLPAHFPIEIDQWVIMPNHFHAIFFLLYDPVRAKQPGKNVSSIDQHCSGRFAPTNGAKKTPMGTTPGSLGAIVQNFKSNTTREINRIRQTSGNPVWQRNYYEHIIRDDADLDHIRQYILDNPRSWSEDSENLTHPS